MKCEEVRDLLPEYVDRDLHPVGEMEVHLASCPGCRLELGSYRGLLSALAVMRDSGEEILEEQLERTLALIPSPSIRARVRGAIHEHRVLYATLASLGGVAVSAAALAVVWRRSAQPAVTA